MISYSGCCSVAVLYGMSKWFFVLTTGDTAGETVAEPTEQQQGGGEVIENPDAPEAPDNPDGYLAEEGGADAEGATEPEALPAKE